MISFKFCKGEKHKRSKTIKNAKKKKINLEEGLT